MKTQSFILLSCLVCFIVCSCSPWKQTLVSQGNINNAVENAINDFVHTSKKLLRDDNTFSILIDTLDNNIIYVEILGVEDPVYANESTMPGSQHKSFPTQYRTVNGKLFYWYDPQNFITSEILNVLKEFDHIYYQQYDHDFPYVTMDDSKKAAMYYFCMNDLRHYKKHVSSRRLPEDKLPKMKCK